ncbi:N-acetylglucosaminyltransferase [Photobacterium proteolyticum]|uniref:N-acetylglucosaminyltransferase n=1 Tax=Photobacterium proteolyticum TaxID=1903952 RepID=A0A1Q9G9X5_9GAMM|nr:glycosyltransferase [Photobacterium proteolyticum]OLQ71142.1 N-acetylglucosaminyltransferase [Photobacterium proteolyticum]
MNEWWFTVRYILTDFAGNIANTPLVMAMLLPMLLAFEVPLMILTLSGVLKWFSRQYKEEALKHSGEQPVVSCIITCYSEGEAIRVTVDTLREQLYPGQIEIIAVIDGAQQNAHTYQVARACLHNFEGCKNRQLVLLPKWQRGGRVSTLNSGLAVAKGEIIINVDGDTSFDNNMVDEIVRCFDDPDVPAVGGALRVRNTYDSLITRMQAFEYMISMHGGKTGLSEWNLINNISGAFGAFRRNFLRSIGGWDTHTAEDLDLTVRIKHYLQRHPGMKIAFAPNAIGHTDVPNTIKTLGQQRLRWDGDLLFLYLRKHIFSLTPRILGWKTFIYTLVFGIGQNIVLPLLVTIYMWWLVFSYPSEFVAAIIIGLYLIYWVFSIINYLVFVIAVSERPLKDLKIALWIVLFPIYTFAVRMWAAVALLNEIFRSSHEESGMAPWWVLKRGHRFRWWQGRTGKRSR